jgi:hypothetical protein
LRPGFHGLLIAPVTALAQQTVWREPVYAEVVRADHGGAVEQVPFTPFESVLDVPRPVMLILEQGAPGIVLAGAATIGDSMPADPTTPYAAKIDGGDGHVLWSWQPEPAAPTEGRIRSAAIAADGAIFLAGAVKTSPDEDLRALVVKLDGATGAELWRLTGDEGTTAFGVAIDADGDAIVTGSEPNVDGQRVTRYAGADGTVAWSHVIAAGVASWDDFRVAIAPGGDVYAGGYYFDFANPEGSTGVQVARLGGSDGNERWLFRANETRLDQAQSILAIGDDALVASHVGSIRLAAADGSVIWERADPTTDFRTFDAFVDADGRLFAAGGNHATETASVRRYDPATGDMLWEGALTDGSPPPANAFLVAPAADGSLLSAWYSAPVGAGALDAESGAVAWSRALDPFTEPSFPVGIVQSADGSIFVGAYQGYGDPLATWVVFKLADVTADTLFENGFD